MKKIFKSFIAMVQKLYPAIAKIASIDDMKNFVQRQGAQFRALSPE